MSTESAGAADGTGADGAGAAASGRAGRRAWWRRPAVLAPAGLLVLLAAAYGLDLALAGSDIPRGTAVAGRDLGGLDRSTAAALIAGEISIELLRERPADVDAGEVPVDPAAAGIALDAEATLDAAGRQPLNPWTRVWSLFGGQRSVEPVLTVDEPALDRAVTDLAAAVDLAPVEGTITIDGTTATPVLPVPGRELRTDEAGEAVVTAVRNDLDRVPLPVTVVEPVVTAEGVQATLADFVEPALAGPIALLGPDGEQRAVVEVSVIAGALRFTPGTDGGLEGTLDGPALLAGLGNGLAAFRTPARDARFELQGGRVQVVPSVDGRTADAEALTDAITDVLADAAPRSVTTPLVPSPAEFDTADAEAYGITEQVSTFTTYFTNPNSGENIRVVAAEVDGAVVGPGETFSLNGFTGPRTQAQGYVESTIIEGGEFVQAVGGGISQFATTMFNAVFFAGLEDIYHKPHSYYISRYPAGREATVFYDSIDLTWRNDSDTGIYVDTFWEPGAITVTFYGTRHFDVESASGERYNYTYPETQRKEQDGDCVDQSGSEGFDIAVTRIFRPVGGGSEIRREVFNTRYNAVPTIVCVAPKPPADDDEPPDPPGGG